MSLTGMAWTRDVGGRYEGTYWTWRDLDGGVQGIHPLPQRRQPPYPLIQVRPGSRRGARARFQLH